MSQLAVLDYTNSDVNVSTSLSAVILRVPVVYLQLLME